MLNEKEFSNFSLLLLNLLYPYILFRAQEFTTEAEPYLVDQISCLQISDRIFILITEKFDSLQVSCLKLILSKRTVNRQLIGLWLPSKQLYFHEEQQMLNRKNESCIYKSKCKLNQFYQKYWQGRGWERVVHLSLILFVLLILVLTVE